MGQDHFRKNTFLTHFRPIWVPKTAHFQGISGFYVGQNVSPPDLAPPPRDAIGEFLAQTLDLTRAPPRL